MTERKPDQPSLVGVDDSPKRLSQRHQADQQQLGQFVIDAGRLMHDAHCEDVRIFDVRGLSEMTDYILIASGTSDRQMRSVADDLETKARAVKLSCYGKEVDDRTTWFVLDLVDVVVHLFEPAARAHYDLEMMWGDAPQVAWRR